MWGTGVAMSPGSYCKPCDAYGAIGQPCWLCGSEDLMTVTLPCGGWRHDPNTERAASVAGLIEVDNG